MRVAFVVNDLQLSGGVGVVVQHARQLVSRHGFEVELVLAREQDEPDWRYPGLEDVPVRAMPSARGERYDIVVATWWETVAASLELDARRHAYFVQSLEDRFYRPDQPDRLGAALTHDLPLHVITEARWIADTLDELYPERRCLLVRNGVDKAVFAPLETAPIRRTEPLRILVEGDADVWFKGVGEAVAATRAMTAPRHVTLVSRSGAALDGVDRALGRQTAEQMSALYAESDVVLKLSRVEGMFGPPLEGFHRGATCVVTAVTGHEEYVEHGFNGLIVEWDDERGTARALDTLATDRALLHLLRANALQTARAWPSWEQAGTMMAGALHALARAPEAAPLDGAAAALATARAAIESQAMRVAERDRLRYRVAGLAAFERVIERPPLRWIAAGPRALWSAARRAKARRRR
ncbi:MAG TPA: glycosyltransferase family 4 protein [Solirubrobacteraceae bacterium]|nr:glycosyltransferase family 4 protein [Solirubrobacteraceae bacterium]